MTASGAVETLARVSRCARCGAQLVAGRRGPLPSSCSRCRLVDELELRVQQAIAIAVKIDDRAVLAALVETLAEVSVAGPLFTRYQATTSLDTDISK